MQPRLTTPLILTPSPSPRQQLTATVKRLAAEHGLTIASVTSAEPFDGLADALDRHIAAGHVNGLDWFTAERARFARYAWGIDYHDLLKARMRSFLTALQHEVGQPVESRSLVDTARIVDRAVAARA